MMLAALQPGAVKFGAHYVFKEGQGSQKKLFEKPSDAYALTAAVAVREDFRPSLHGRSIFYKPDTQEIHLYTQSSDENPTAQDLHDDSALLYILASMLDSRLERRHGEAGVRPNQMMQMVNDRLAYYSPPSAYTDVKEKDRIFEYIV